MLLDMPKKKPQPKAPPAPEGEPKKPVGRPPRGIPIETVAAEVPRSLKDRLQAIAIRNRRTLTQEVLRALEQHLLVEEKEAT